MSEAHSPQVHSCGYCSKLLVVHIRRPNLLEYGVATIFHEVKTRISGDRIDVEEKLEREILPQRLTATELLEGAAVGCQFLAHVLYGKRNSTLESALADYRLNSRNSGPTDHAVSSYKRIESQEAMQLLQNPRTRVALEIRYENKPIGIRSYKKYLSQFWVLLENPPGVYYAIQASDPFYIHSVRGYPAENAVGRIMPNYEPGSDVSIERAKKWLHTCDSSHFCLKRVEGRPSRILRLQRIESGLAVAFLTSCANVDRYTALSYVWGVPQLSTRLTKTRIDTATAGILSNLLPKTIQDAITVTLDLGLQFLWVDSLCIVQDDAVEMAKELPKMAGIYRGAYVTISAAATSHCDHGFLHSRAELASKDWWTRIAYRSDDAQDNIYIPHQLEPVQMSSEPINTRGWTLQEHILSPRLLIYGSRQLRWSCSKMDKTDGGDLLPRGYNRAADDGVLKSNLDYESYGKGEDLLFGTLYKIQYSLMATNESREASRAFRGNSGTQSTWRNIVETYTSRDITNPSDKLRAISAIAQYFGIGLQDEYLAGLWRSSLLDNLMWMVREPLRARPALYRAPSWSWASVDDPIEHEIMPLSTNQDTPRVIDCRVEVVSSLAPFADVKFGYIKLMARVRAGISISPDWLLYDQNTRCGYGIRMRPDAFGPAYTTISVWCLELGSSYRTTGAHLNLRGLVLEVTDQVGVFKRLGWYHDVGQGTPEELDCWEGAFQWDEITII